MISADFATAAVLISFGVVLGVTSPLQLIVMTVLEIIIFVFNEIIGRDIIGAVDAGDTIFVHLFGAYFGLSVGGFSTILNMLRARKKAPLTTVICSPW
jgi:ammonium transporter Rh